MSRKGQGLPDWEQPEQQQGGASGFRGGSGLCSGQGFGGGQGLGQEHGGGQKQGKGQQFGLRSGFGLGGGPGFGGGVGPEQEQEQECFRVHTISRILLTSSQERFRQRILRFSR